MAYETPTQSADFLGDDDPDERQTWGNSIEFLMSCIAMNVGLGNIWRFPFVAYENGGGAFLIPYILVLILLGRPMFFLEMSLGQFCSWGNVKMFEKLAPFLRGIGYGQLLATSCVATYYCVLIALSLFYLVQSFRRDLPWAVCHDEWESSEFSIYKCVPSSSDVNTEANNTMSSAELYFRIDVLKQRTDIDSGIGYPDWQLTLCLAVSWLMTFALCARGIRSSGKASYFLAIFPYFILIGLLVRAVTLEGASKGILYFITPQWESLLKANVWYAAVTQCYFSLNIGFGSVTMYASYNKFRHNIHRDAMVVATLDTFTSLLSGMIIFGILGNLAHKMNLPISNVVKSGGTGLAFISYPEAIARFETVPWLFSILFFLMLVILGVGSLIALQGCVFTVITDEYRSVKIWHATLLTTTLGFLIGLSYVTPGGQYIFAMIDFFGGTFIFFVLNICEVFGVIYWYGLRNICWDIEYMCKMRPGVYFRICWIFFIPVVMMLVLLYFLVTLEELKYEGRSYPTYIIVWGWLIAAIGILQPIIWISVDVIRGLIKGKTSKDIKTDLFDNAYWGPKDANRFLRWKNYKSRVEEDYEMKKRNCFIDTLKLIFNRR